jgi:hypothetical protein
MRRYFLISLIICWVGLDLASSMPATRLLMDTASIEKFEEIDPKSKEERTIETRYSVRRLQTPVNAPAYRRISTLPPVSRKQAFHPPLTILHSTLLI